MKGVRDEPLGTKSARELRPVLDDHVVNPRGAIDVGVVVDVSGLLTRNVLNERSAERHVDDLKPTTDGECRNPSALGFARQGDLAGVARVVDVYHPGACAGPVRARG